ARIRALGNRAPVPLFAGTRLPGRHLHRAQRYRHLGGHSPVLQPAGTKRCSAGDRRMTSHRPHAHDSSMGYEQLARYTPQIEALAESHGLDFHPVDFELVPNTFMMEVAVYGLPIRM